MDFYSNFANSAYGKGKVGALNIIEDAVRNNRVLYFDDKKSHALLSSVAEPNALNGLRSGDQYDNIARFKDGVKHKFPTSEEIMRSKLNDRTKMEGSITMRGFIKDAWFIHNLDWYEVVEGIGYVPTDKAPPEAVEAMERLNELTEEDIA